MSELPMTRPWTRRLAISLHCIAATAWLASVAAIAAAEASEGNPFPIDEWREPPAEARPLARWWWPGGSVDAQALETSLREIRAAGFGAVEIQPLLLGLDAADLARDGKLRTVGQRGFRAAVATAAAKASQLGLAVDVTLGSGWPGGLPTAKENAAHELLMSTTDVRGPTRFRAAPPPPPAQSYRRIVTWILDTLGPADPAPSLLAVVAARRGEMRNGIPTLADMQVLSGAADHGRLDWSVPEGDWRIFAFYLGATGHFVLGGAFPGAVEDARVVDHLSQRGADALLDGYARPLLESLPPGGLRGLFVDSFELVGELPFTGDFPVEFERRTGYDIVPYLPLLFRRGGEAKYAEMADILGRNGGPLYLAAEPGKAERVREDYERVRAELFAERFVGTLARWAHEHGIELRLQAHGGYADYLDTYALADVPESEGLFAGGSFDFLELAASAAHVAGRRWASSESFVSLRLWGTRLAPDDLRLLAGRAYAAGINRLVFHGVPYPYTRANGKPWYPFPGGFGGISAGPLPFSSRFDAAALAGLPEFTTYVGRLSVAMSHGEPVADVAWLRSDPIYPDSAGLDLGQVDIRPGESPVTGALRARGLVYDRVSRRMLAAAEPVEGGLRIGRQTYRALLLDPLPVAEPALVERIATVADAGAPVVALGALPERAPGLADAAARDIRVRVAAQTIAARAVRVSAAQRLESVLAAVAAGGFVRPADAERLDVALETRHCQSGETVLVFNESRRAATASIRFARAGKELTLWEPGSGRRTILRDSVQAGDVVPIGIDAGATIVLTVRTQRTNSAEAPVAVSPPHRGDSPLPRGEQPG